MTSSRPYLIRAIYEWIVDNDKTPYLLVNASFPGAVVPESFVENGRIILNISPSAARNVSLLDDYISFSARFSGKAMEVFVPTMGVMAIYAKENGQGMVFADDDNNNIPPPDDAVDDKPAKPKPKRASLRVVK